MASYLIADSGSTKTDWCLIQKNKKPLFYKTSGFNPYIQKKTDIASILQQEFPKNELPTAPGRIFYYGAGSSSKEKKLLMTSVLQQHFGTEEVQVQGDLLGAARAVCGDKKGIICIMGTGSSSCYYNGEKVKEQQPSLGYLAGDEGSGNYIGKRILQYYAYSTFDEELRMAFELKFGNDIRAIINKLYHEPFPNRYLASFVVLLTENRGHYMVENMIEDCINDFFNASILKYRQSWKHPLNFVGSVAYEFRDVVQHICNQYELEIGNIIQSPVEGLIQYHKKVSSK